MKCSRCGDYRETVGEVRACVGCQDGTAQQIPADMPDSVALADAAAVKDGLANRFKRGSLPVEESAEVTVPAVDETPAKPEAPVPKRKKRNTK